MFYSKAVKTQTGCFNLYFVRVCRFTEVSFLLHNNTSVCSWQRILVAVVLSVDEVVELHHISSTEMRSLGLKWYKHNIADVTELLFPSQTFYS